VSYSLPYGRTSLTACDPYELRSLPGHYSGLHLVSILYAGSKILDSTADVGFDLSREYDQAKSFDAAGG
jgi:hypothetical protein